MNKDLVIAGRLFKSRLMIGTGKFSSPIVMRDAINASGCEVVTVALRRVDIENPSDDILSNIDTENILLLPNTSGAKDSCEAVRLARLARAATGNIWVKLEVTPDPYNLLPDPIETFNAAKILVKEGFNVMPYINADPILAKRLEEIGCVTVMPLAAPIGTNRGITTKEAIQIIIEQSNVPVVVDAGIGRVSHAAYAIELGADALLINTAIATAVDPVKMAYAFKLAIEAAIHAKLAGEPPMSDKATPSSPDFGYLAGLE